MKLILFSFAFHFYCVWHLNVFYMKIYMYANRKNVENKWKKMHSRLNIFNENSLPYEELEWNEKKKTGFTWKVFHLVFAAHFCFIWVKNKKRRAEWKFSFTIIWKSYLWWFFRFFFFAFSLVHVQLWHGIEACDHHFFFFFHFKRPRRTN